MRWPTEHGRQRRWRERSPFQAGGVWYRVVHGRKGSDDLRLEQRIEGRWAPVYMEQVFMLVDFFHENEQWLEQARDNWRRGGGSYFLDQVRAAAAVGWEQPAQRIVEQRARLVPAPHVCGAYCTAHR